MHDLFRGFAEEMLSLGMTKTAAASMSKEEAEYTDGPKKGKKCAGCTHYVGGGVCEVVKGKINPNGWCRYWAAGREGNYIRRSIKPTAKPEPKKGAPTTFDRPSAAVKMDTHGGDSD